MVHSTFAASLYLTFKFYIENACAHVVNFRDKCFDRGLTSLHSRLIEGGVCAPDRHIDVLPAHRLIYVCVPKSGSSTVKRILCALIGSGATSIERVHKRKYSCLKSPTLVGLMEFRRLAADPRTLRFSFVRNPYARLVSAWADKFQNKPLVSDDSFVEQYRTFRCNGGSSSAGCADRPSTFEEFVEFAENTARSGVNAHWQLQDDILAAAPLKLDFIGKLENFQSDIIRVLDHVRASPELRELINIRMNASRHRPWASYYSAELADRVYRIYERDFDRFKYPRRIHDYVDGRTSSAMMPP